MEPGRHEEAELTAMLSTCGWRVRLQPGPLGHRRQARRRRRLLQRLSFPPAWFCVVFFCLIDSHQLQHAPVSFICRSLSLLPPHPSFPLASTTHNHARKH